MDLNRFLADTVGGILGRAYEPQISFDPSNVMYLSDLNKMRNSRGLDPVSTGYYMSTYLPNTMRPNELLGTPDIGSGALNGTELNYVNQNPYMFSALFNNGRALNQLTPQQDFFLQGLFNRRQF